MEKRLFKKAFCAHKKDFYLIHKTVRHMGVDKTSPHTAEPEPRRPVRGDLCSFANSL